MKHGGTEEYASAIGREYAMQRSAGGGRRDPRDAADYMKRETEF